MHIDTTQETRPMDPGQRHRAALEALQLDNDPDTREAAVQALWTDARRRLSSLATSAAFLSAEQVQESVRVALRLAGQAATITDEDPSHFWNGSLGRDLVELSTPILEDTASRLADATSATIVAVA